MRNETMIKDIAHSLKRKKDQDLILKRVGFRFRKNIILGFRELCIQEKLIQVELLETFMEEFIKSYNKNKINE